MAKSLCAGLLHEMIDVIEKRAMSTIEELWYRDIKRNVTQTLANICKNRDLLLQLKDCSDLEEPLEDILERWNEAEDDILRANVQVVLHELQ